MTKYNLIGEVTFTQEMGDDIIDLGSDTSQIRSLKDAIHHDFKTTMGPKGLAEYLDYNYEKLEPELIKSIMVDVDIRGNKVISIAEVCAARDLTTNELEIVKEYISGQYSDGWGEGFEQYEIDTVSEEVQIEYFNEETEEVEYEYEFQDCPIFAHFWSPVASYEWN